MTYSNFAKEKESKLILIFTISYLVIFTILAFARKNYEFLYYTVIMSSLIILIVLYHKKLHLSPIILGGLSILGFMHVAGGNFYLYGVRLYDLYIFGSIIRYDNLVHVVGVFIATFVGYSVLKPYLVHRIEHHPIVLSLILVLIALGIGAANEILEFVAVVFLGAQEAVGNYFNNALDLVFNMFGSIVAVLFIYTYHKKQIQKK